MSNTFRSPEYEKMYNFTQFACQLNEMEDNVATTDSRLRPDQRLMEIGKWDEANVQKVRLEEKQRAVRRKREQEAEIAAQEGEHRTLVRIFLPIIERSRARSS